jgi:hypothetical protein
MEKLERYALISLFSGYVIKLLVVGASLADAAIVLFLAALYYLYISQIQNKQIVQLKQEVTELKENITSLKKDNEDFRSAVAQVKISNGLRNVR